MVSKVTVEPATAQDVQELTEIFARSFKTDPLQEIIFPEGSTPELMKASQAGLFHIFIDDPTVVLLKAIYEGQMVGFAHYSRPSAVKSTSADEWIPPAEVVAAADTQFMDAFMKLKHENRKKYIGDQLFWALELIGTDPAAQGKGVASALLKYGADQADTEGYPIWLEASPTGRQVYERRDFHLVAEMSLQSPKTRRVLEWPLLMRKPRVSVQTAQPEDADRLAEIFISAFVLQGEDDFDKVLHPDGMDVPERQARMSGMLAKTASDPTALLLKAVLNGKIAGWSEWQRPTDDPIPLEQFPDGLPAVKERGMDYAVMADYRNAGFASRRKHLEGRRFWSLELLAVDPTYQRKGIGSALLKHVAALADKDGYPSWIEATKKGSALYAQKGFVTKGTDRLTSKRTGQTYEWPYMVREPVLDAEEQEQQSIRKGRCGCDAVHFELLGTEKSAWVCHCHDCQRDTGSLMSYHCLIDTEQFRFTKGAKSVTKFIDPTNQGWKTFCKICGCPIACGASSMADKIILNVGAMAASSPPIMKPSSEVFTCRRPKWIQPMTDVKQSEKI